MNHSLTGCEYLDRGIELKLFRTDKKMAFIGM
jgi:hypothetical protein